MNRRQKALLRESIIILIITILAMVTIVNVKDWLNRREALLAMQELGIKLLTQRQEQGAVPPLAYVEQVLNTIAGRARLEPGLNYRARWIGLDAPADTILAYTHKRFRSRWVDSGYVVLRLDGHVEWLAAPAFKIELEAQQTPEERQAQSS